MRRIAIVAALPGELRPLVAGWRHEIRSGVDLWSSQNDGTLYLAGCAGAGRQAAERVLAQIEEAGPLAAVCSLGWAGALNHKGKPGAVYRVTGVIDEASNERYLTAFQGPTCWLLTSTRVASHREKLVLVAQFGADLVDMEASALARAARERKIPFYCVKGVSDGVADVLPDFNRFILPDGRFQLARFVVFAAFRPHCWGALIRMGKNARKAAEGFAAALANALN